MPAPDLPPAPRPLDATTGTGDAPQRGLGYERLRRLTSVPRSAWGWALLGVVVLVPGLLVANVLVATAAVLVAGGDTSAVSTDPLTPSGLAVVNLGWAVAIPGVVLVALLVHGQRPGLLASVAGRLRWRWMAVCFGLAVLTLVATVLVATLLPTAGAGGDVEAGRDVLNEYTRSTTAYLLIIALLTPLQAAGEEYAFRGYLTQALGGLLRSARVSRAVAVVVPALLFALAHGAQDPPVFVDRFAFGLVAGWLVVRTGGLEAGIAMHVLNNWLAFGLALLVGDIESSLTPSGGSWWSLPTTLTQSLVYLALVTWAARRLRLTTTAPAAPTSVLEAPGGRM